MRSGNGKTVIKEKEENKRDGIGKWKGMKRDEEEGKWKKERGKLESAEKRIGRGGYERWNEVQELEM